MSARKQTAAAAAAEQKEIRKAFDSMRAELVQTSNRVTTVIERLRKKLVTQKHAPLRLVKR